jgi:hypothetical protein
MKNKVIGYYNELEYSIVEFNEDEPMGNELYRAGNHPNDSQVYTSKEKGVGLDTMKKYCKQTTKDIAKEHKAKYGGIEYEALEQ